MAWRSSIRRDWSLRRIWPGPTWEYTVLTVHHAALREGGSASMVRHSVVVLRDGVVQARMTHTEVVDPAADQRVQSTWFERYLPGLIDGFGREGWRIVSFAYGAPIRVVFARPG